MNKGDVNTHTWKNTIQLKKRRRRRRRKEKMKLGWTRTSSQKVGYRKTSSACGGEGVRMVNRYRAAAGEFLLTSIKHSRMTMVDNNEEKISLQYREDFECS